MLSEVKDSAGIIFQILAAKGNINYLLLFFLNYCLKDSSSKILNLNNKLSRIQSSNQKVTLIISEIYHQCSNNNELPSGIDTQVDINQLIDVILADAIQICEIKYNNFPMTIERNYDEHLPKISCISSDIERALDNIISNAMYHLYQKFTEVKNYQPKLSISTQNQSNSIEIKIRDNGRGIPSSNLDQIFQIFWTTKTSPEGLGLGLHFAKELVEKHSGEISVTSIEGEYTELTVTLPHNCRLIKEAEE